MKTVFDWEEEFEWEHAEKLREKQLRIAAEQKKQFDAIVVNAGWKYEEVLEVERLEELFNDPAFPEVDAWEGYR